MTENIQVALIALCSSLVGGLVAGFFTLRATRNATDREDNRREKERKRKLAEEMIDRLYEPLMKLMIPTPPYDEPPVDDETGRWIIKEVWKNSLYASSGLLRVASDFGDALYNDRGRLHKENLHDRLFEMINSDYGMLKKMIGYDTILKEESAIKVILKRLKSKIEMKYIEIGQRLFIRKVRKRRMLDK